MNIYVGNLAYQITEDDLRQAFEAFGEVESARIISERYTGRSKGFGFVEMPDDAQAQAGIDGLNGTDLAGRTLTANEARPRPNDRGSMGGAGPRGGGGGGRQGGGGFDRGGRGGY